MPAIPRDAPDSENERCLALARADIAEHGLPPTPSRWMRSFGWNYTRARLVFDRLSAESKTGNAGKEHP